MTRVSSAGLLVVASVAFVILLEVRTLLGMIGIDIDPVAHLIITVATVGLIVVVLDWFPDIAGDSDEIDEAAN